MKVGGIDALGMVDAVRGAQRAKGVDSDHDSEHAFERELARLLIREVGKSLEDGFGGEEAAAVHGMLEEELVDRLVADGLFDTLPSRAPSGVPAHAHARVHGSHSGHGHGRHHAHGTGDLPVHGRISSRYGLRSDPFHGGTRRHDGVDISAPVGAPVQAARSGTVRFAGERGGYGNLVIVDHGGGLETWYAHLSEIRVTPGSRIRARQDLGAVGQTGRATGPHLHLEVRKNGRPIDPSQFFPEIHSKSGGHSDR